MLKQSWAASWHLSYTSHCEVKTWPFSHSPGWSEQDIQENPVIKTEWQMFAVEVLQFSMLMHET